MMNRVVVGARGSKLAQVQAKSVIDSLSELYPSINFTLISISTGGDRQTSTSIDRLPGFGVFVKELEEALLDNHIDLAVHSLKDVPFQIPEGLTLAAILERIDPRDVIITRGETLEELKPASVIGTGSPRRIAQLRGLRDDLLVKGIRGNVDTRLRKLAGGEYDGIMLAAAGMIRLGLQENITQFLPPEKFVPRAGQGVLCVETKAGSEAGKLVKPLDNILTRSCVNAERAFEETMGGGCSAAVGCLCTTEGDLLKLSAMAAGKGEVYQSTGEGEPASAENAGRRLAEKLLKMGASGT
ncbi:hydroxymethylbilane synthase [Chloroflexota bacterium]